MTSGRDDAHGEPLCASAELSRSAEAASAPAPAPAMACAHAVSLPITGFDTRISAGLIIGRRCIRTLRWCANCGALEVDRIWYHVGRDEERS
jgi:hypothetical protein